MSTGTPDVRRILTAQAVRAFGYGFAAVLLGSMLADRYSALRAGMLLATVVAGGAVMSLLVGAWADRFGRRRTYVALYLVLAASGAMFAVTDGYLVLVVVALAGALSTEVIDSGPYTTLEQTMLAEATADQVRTRVFGRYNAVAALAGSVGALAAGVPGLLAGVVTAFGADRRLFALLVPVGLAGAIVAARLSPAVEPRSVPSGRPGRARLSRSRRRVAGLAALFAVDAFGGGFAVQSFIAYWLAERFDASLTSLGVLFFAAGLAQAASFVAAPRIADRIGLLATMVFTHLPSNVLLAAIAFAPTFPATAVLLLARQLLSQMDVPTRQAYLAALVDPAERAPAAAVTNAARYLARPPGPALAGAAAALGTGVPFLLAGAIKAGYDLTLWATFRAIPLHRPPVTSDPKETP